MGQEEIKTGNAPEAIGPYAQAVRAGKTVYLSGQIPLDPATMEMAEGGIEAQTAQVLKNLKAVLEEAGAGVGNVVKTTVYLADITMFAEMNAIYAEFFGYSRPARATVEVARLPKNALVEIDAVAVID